MQPKDRPLSPFMFGQLYRWQMSSITSSLHRLTGIFMFGAFLLLILWLVGVAADGGLADAFYWIATSWFAKFIYLVSLWAVWFHLLNGIRHLAWDLIYGFDLEFTKKTGKFNIIASAILAVITIILI